MPLKLIRWPIWIVLILAVLLQPYDDVVVQSYALAQMDKVGLSQQFASILAPSIIPSLVQYVRRNRTTVEGHHYSLMVLLDDILESQVSVELNSHPIHPNKKIQIQLNAYNVTGASRRCNDHDDDENKEDSCERDQLRMEQLSLKFDFGLEDDNETIRFVPDSDFELLGWSHERQPSPVEDPSSCHGEEDVDYERHTFKFLYERVSKFLAEYLKPRTFSVSKLPSIPSPNGNIRIHLDIQNFMVSEDSVILRGGALFTAQLNRTGWRSGRSLTPQASTPALALDGPSEYLVSCSLGLDGVNALVESAWYLAWAEATTTEQQAEQSNLCIPSESDACPFPPMVQSSKNITAVNLALSAFFLPSGLFKHFTMYVLAPPLKLQVQEHPNSITGSSAAQIYMDGTSYWTGKEVRLAIITIPISMTATIPQYDASTGYFHGLEIIDAKYGSPVTKFPRQPYTNKMASFPMNFAVGPANAEMKKQLPELNRQVAEALARMPLYINPLRNIPLPGMTMHFDLESVHISTVAQGVEHQDGYFTLDANLVVTVSENDSGECNARATDAKTSSSSTTSRVAASSRSSVR